QAVTYKNPLRGKRHEALPARFCNWRLAALARALREPCRHDHWSRSLVRSAVASEPGVTTMGFIDMREWMSLLEKAGELRFCSKTSKATAAVAAPRSS